jgi:hypothetical protein
MTKYNTALLATIIKDLTFTRNKINITRENVRWIDAETTMGELGLEIEMIDDLLQKLVYIKDHDKEN